MKIIIFFLQHSRKRVLLSLAGGAFSGICNAALLGVINALLKSNNSSSALLWSYVGLCVLLPVTRFTAEWLLTRMGQEALFEQRMRLCRQILAAPLRHLEQIGEPRLLATLTEDIPTITGAIVNIPLLTVNLALVVGCLIYMGMLSWALFAIVLGFMIVGIISYQLPNLHAQKVFSLARKEADKLLANFRALTQGAKELKIHAERRQVFLQEKLEASSKSLMSYNVRGLTIYGAAASWGQSLVFIVIGLIILAFPHFRPLSSSTMTAYVITLLYLMAPLQVVMNMLPQIVRANVSLRNVQDMGFTLSSQHAEEIAVPQPVPTNWKELKLSGVTHCYQREGEAENFLLGPINLCFQPGELTFITGGNGSGKTTLAKLLIGLYVPESGEIYFDHQKIDSESRERYRQNFSVVFSDFFLFGELLGQVSSSVDEEARLYLEKLKLTKKVQIEQGKFSTIDLSQGQRKRLALLTAFLEDRQVYVFDEWAADQDPYFKAVFYTQLLPELRSRNKTVLVISHDDRYYNLADRIIKLEEGQVVSDLVVAPHEQRAMNSFAI